MIPTSETSRYKGLQGEAKLLDKGFLELLRQSHLHLHEKKVGNFQIKIEVIPAFKELTVVSVRNWLMMGYKQLKVKYDCPRLIYKLFKNDLLLMSDSPQEMFLQYEAYKNAKGKVLVGGLGLGLYANMVALKDEVTEVVVVEIDKDVIKLCRPRNNKIKVVHDDIWNFIKTTNEKFDYAYIDIHSSTGCMEYVRTVLPMRKVLEERFPNMSIDFWGEEEMKAQYDPNFDDKWMQKPEVT
jgi:hypothetical protein